MQFFESKKCETREAKNGAGSYLYGFNGKENDNEVKGEGNQQDYGMRIYDPRIGKFLSVDPITKQYPELTPYQFASNRPIDGIDLDGLEFTEYHYPQIKIKERRATMTPEQLEKDKQRELKYGIGVAAVPAILVGAVVAGPTAAVFTTTTATQAIRFATPPLAWAAANPQAIQEGGTFVLGIINPTPDDLNPGSSSDELGRVVGKGFKSLTKAIFEEDGYAVVRDGLGKVAGKGWLSQGELNLTIKTKGTELEGRGGDVFNDILNFVSHNFDEVHSIRGTWRAGDMADNLKTFNKLVGEVGAEKAAFQTFTGKMAERAGYNKASVTLGVKDSDGNYTSVDVLFRKE